MDIGNMHRNLVKIARVALEISWWADRQTDRQKCSSQYFAILRIGGHKEEEATAAKYNGLPIGRP